MAKFYIATGLQNVANHNIVRDRLLSLGHEITYDWTTHGNVKNTSLERLREVAHFMFDLGIKAADYVVVILPGGKGTHTELGASLALNKKVFVYSEDEEVFLPTNKTCGFYHHDLCHCLTDKEKIFQAIKHYSESVSPAVR